jgi:hypothetical protein
MKHLQTWKTRAGFLLGGILFATFIVTPNVFAAGYTWTSQTGSPTQFWGDIGSSGDGKYLVAGSTQGYIYTSSDYGSTWAPLTAFGSTQWITENQIALSSDGKYQIVMGNDELVSSNYGATWTEPFLPGSLMFSTVAMSSDGKHVAATTYNTAPGNGDIWTSNDYGVTWTDQTASGSRNWYGITSSSDGSHLAAVVNNGDIYTSVDYGTTWTDQTAAGTQPWSGIVSSADGQRLTAITGSFPSTGDIWTSNDYGNTWTDEAAAGNRNWYDIASNSDSSLLAAVVNNGDIYISSDYGVTWTDQTPAGTSNWNAIASNASGSRLVAGKYHDTIWTAYDPALDPPASNPGSTTTSTPDPAGPLAPDTGYGVPSQSNPLVTLLIAGAIVSTTGGLALLHRQKRFRNSLDS